MTVLAFLSILMTIALILMIHEDARMYFKVELSKLKHEWVWNNAISMIEISYVNYCILLGVLIQKLLLNQGQFVCKSEQAIDIINLVIYAFMVVVV